MYWKWETIDNEEQKKPQRSRFQRHASVLIWKSYQQRQRRWRLLLCETLFAGVMFLFAIFIARPVFMTPLQAEPEPPSLAEDMMKTMEDTILGYAPDVEPYNAIMSRVSQLLNISVISGSNEEALESYLYNLTKGSPITSSVTWVIWKPQMGNVWRLSIRSTERARHAMRLDLSADMSKRHIHTEFISVQLAVSHCLLEHTATTTPRYELSLVSMPVSPLMAEAKVRQAISWVMLCFTIAFIPPVLETETVVVIETHNKFKRALRIYGVYYSTMYIGWLSYAILTSLPICLLGAITLMVIFRWIHLFVTIIVVFAYFFVMVMLALITGMFHNKASMACVWSTIMGIFQTFLAELLVHHDYGDKYDVVTFLLSIIVPPLGLVHSFNQFSLLQTGKGGFSSAALHIDVVFIVLSWVGVILLYFALLMLLQKTIGHSRAIGGQVSWKSIIFKKVVNVNKLCYIETPTGIETQNLQEVDDLVAKAITMRKVCKNIMGARVLKDVTLDIYRGEFTTLFSEKVQEKLLVTVEDLLTGLTYPDNGTINILGEEVTSDKSFFTTPHMVGYCHHCKFLIEDLTVQEHLIFYTEICLWNESRQYIAEYNQIRSKRLLKECDLDGVKHHYVRNLDIYYRAQLCWALALLMEPRIVILPAFTDRPGYLAVIKDKIMQYKKYITIVNFSFASIQLEYADRVFLFDNKVLVFGGTPAYMFYKYGREYRVRLTIRSSDSLDDDAVNELMERAAEAGATVRAHLGSLLILRLPANPSDVVANLVTDLTENSGKYGISSMNISVPDSEEICRRAINESRAAKYESTASSKLSKEALKRIAEATPWKRKKLRYGNFTHLRNIGWKFFSFYIHYRFFLIVTIIAAVFVGSAIGMSLSKLLEEFEYSLGTKKLLLGDMLTVESLNQKTTLVVHMDNSSDAISVADAYVLSHTGSTNENIINMEYTALKQPESLTEYLVTRAIDSPQYYVYMYAYGLNVARDANGTLVVQALYSPFHHDFTTAARSLSRVFMALIRHYSGTRDASIEITDEPLILDFSTWSQYASEPPLFIQFLLIVTLSHITFIPSMEYGLIRHTQTSACNFSPSLYWFTLYFCDLILYWMLVGIMTVIMISVVYYLSQGINLHFKDLLVVPFILIIYGIGCVPQAYVFSLGPRPALNFIAFIIVSIVFGETTIIAKLFYGNALNYAVYLMSLSPQFNMAYAYVKIKKIFLYNTECDIFEKNNVCSSEILHKCCEKCGVMQKCFSRKSYITDESGIFTEVTITICTALVFMVLILLWEHKLIQGMRTYMLSRMVYHDKTELRILTPGAEQEFKDVLAKKKQIKNQQVRDKLQKDTFGEYLLAENVTENKMGAYTVRNVYFGLGKGEALALSGLKRHGRLRMCEILAGYHMPSSGQMWCMSKWTLNRNPKKYISKVSLSCERESLPPWMTVRDALELIGLLRGIPKKFIKNEMDNYIEALELKKEENLLICHLQRNDRTRLHFAAAVIGAPPIIVLDECTAYQKYSVRRAMYYILYYLRKSGHAVFISCSNVESHMPVTNRLAIMVDGYIYDIDQVDNLVERYSNKGYTVVVHLKDEVDVTAMFSKYFKKFSINDISEVLVNIQLLDPGLNWAKVFEAMERLKAENEQVYSYIVTAIPIDYVYNSILSRETGQITSVESVPCYCLRWLIKPKQKITPKKQQLDKLINFEQKYDITKLKELPWSVIFHSR